MVVADRELCHAHALKARHTLRRQDAVHGHLARLAERAVAEGVDRAVLGQHAQRQLARRHTGVHAQPAATEMTMRSGRHRSRSSPRPRRPALAAAEGEDLAVPHA